MGNALGYEKGKWKRKPYSLKIQSQQQVLEPAVEIGSSENMVSSSIFPSRNLTHFPFFKSIAGITII